MISKNRYESIVLKEIQGLSERELFKVIKTIHFLKKEILREKQGNVADILRFAGIWKDIPQNQIDIFSEILREREQFSKGRPVFE